MKSVHGRFLADLKHNARMISLYTWRDPIRIQVAVSSMEGLRLALEGESEKRSVCNGLVRGVGQTMSEVHLELGPWSPGSGEELMNEWYGAAMPGNAESLAVVNVAGFVAPLTADITGICLTV